MNAHSPFTSPPAARQDYRHRRHTVAPGQTSLGRLGLRLQDGIENAIAAASPFGDPHVYQTDLFPWARELEAEWRLIRAELDRVMKFRDHIPNFQDILKEVATIQTDDRWKTFFLTGIGMNCTANRARCPETWRLLQKIPGLKTAFFSILSPHKHIPAHRGAYNGILRFHLGLIVPEPREDCRIRIGNDFYTWDEGRALIFDDTFNHEVWNDTDGFRVVLFVDFARPLYQPWHAINNAFLNVGAIAPFLREAGAKQKAWEKEICDNATR
jgi:beta-hydroxylase